MDGRSGANDLRRFHELLEFALDGSATDAQREEFARLLDAHPQWTATLAQDLVVHSLLQWHCQDVLDDVEAVELTRICRDDLEAADVQPGGGGGQAGHGALRRAVAASGTATVGSLQPSIADEDFRQTGYPSHVVSHDSEAVETRTSGRYWPLWLAGALAAMLLMGWFISHRDAQLPTDGRVVAEVIAAEEVTWSERSTALHGATHIAPGRLETTGGTFTLKFRSGATMHVRGASSMMIESDMLVHLDRGQATAQVPQSAIGFRINTPVINVIDQGTEFGVAVRDRGLTDVIVFDGIVDLEDSISRGGTAKRLEQGEGARVDRAGGFGRIMQVGRNASGGWWTQDFPESDPSVIREVRDNIPPSDGSKYFCYQITVQGLEDDAGAYGDRHPHQWNGLTKSGLPTFLRGADYVKTFNDYRYMNDFAMVVELARPANLYVFFDDRVPLPDWLLERFEDTGVDIGLDEGPWEGIPHHRTATGPGQSIDNVFSVWVRRCAENESVELGPVGDSSEARAMYGIAATPRAVEPASAGLQRSRDDGLVTGRR